MESGSAGHGSFVDPRRFELTPGVAPDLTLHVEDTRTPTHPDDDLIEFGFEWHRDGGGSVAVTLDLDETTRLRDALTAIIETQLPSE
jgi:hypothetical protein